MKEAGMTAQLPVLGEVTGRVESNGSTSVAVYPGDAAEAANGDGLREALRQVGAVLLTGLPVDLARFSEIVARVGGRLLAYTERSTPRTRLGDNLYTST